MIVGDSIGFAAIDWLGQTPIPTTLTPVPTSLTPTPPVSLVPAPPPGYPYYPPPPGYPPPPAGFVYSYPTGTYPTTVAPVAAPAPAPVPTAVTTGPAGTQVIPIVQIGPVRIMDRSGYSVPNVMVTLRTPGRIIKTESVAGGIYQTNVDRSDFDAGITAIFGAPDRAAVTVPASALFCNTGTRNEFNTITSMTQNPCPPQSYYFDAAQQVERPGAQAPSEAPAPQAAAPAQAPSPGRKRRKRPGQAQQEAAPVPAGAPGQGVFLATGGGMGPIAYVGIGVGALALIGLVVYMAKS